MNQDSEITTLPEINANQRVEFVMGLNLDELGIDVSTPGSLYFKKLKLGYTDEQVFLEQLYRSFQYLKRMGIPMTDNEFTFIVKILPEIDRYTLKNPLNTLVGFWVINRTQMEIDILKLQNVFTKLISNTSEYNISNTDVIKYARLWIYALRNRNV